MKRTVLAFLCLLIAACAPSLEEVQATETEVAAKVISQLTASAPPPPTRTPTPSFTPTPRPTKTPAPTPTPGAFSNPAPVGTTLYAVEPLAGLAVMSATVLEVHRGEEANALADSTLDWLTYKVPIEGQEYVAVKLAIEVLAAPPNEVFTLYTYWHFTLRYEEDGPDTWSVDTLGKVAEGYPPQEAEAWIFFLVREGSSPMLYFQPMLMIDEQYGTRTSGGYLSLE